jgi:hypothetical protein
MMIDGELKRKCPSKLIFFSATFNINFIVLLAEMRERELSFDYVADDASFYGSNEAMTQSLFRSFRCCQHSCQPSFQYATLLYLFLFID